MLGGGCAWQLGSAIDSVENGPEFQCKWSVSFHGTFWLLCFPEAIFRELMTPAPDDSVWKV